MKFYHPHLKSQNLITAKGKITLDAKGEAEVTQEQYDTLMSIPKNAEHNAKMNGTAPEQSQSQAPEPVQTALEAKPLTLAELEPLELPELRVIAKNHEIKFDKRTTKEQLIKLLVPEEPKQEEPAQSPSTENQQQTQE